MAYVALYRQWRPQDFEQLVGQEHISTTLQNAIVANRIAHAYLFCGPRGTGKTSTAKIMAKSVNCAQGITTHPCNSCDSCKRITDGSSMDVLEIDAASNRGIDEIRDLREKVKFTPVDGRYKVYIIDEVHMLTTEAFNALLKTLEEPPSHAIFILATTEPHKIPATILSRCQRYDFRRIDSESIAERLRSVLQEMSIEADPEAVGIIAQAAEGGLRDALSMLDQCIAFSGEKITADNVRGMLGLAGDEWLQHMLDALLKRDTAGALEHIQELIKMGKDARQVILELIIRFRNLLVEPLSISRDTLASQPIEEYMEIIQMLSDAAQEAKWAPHPRIVLEVTAVRICRRTAASDIQTLLVRIEKLEAMVAQKPAVLQQPHSSVSRKAPEPAPGPRAATSVQQKSVSAAKESKKNDAVPKLDTPNNIGELWEQILSELLRNNKRAIHTCLSEGELLSVSPEQIVFGFRLSIYKERVEKEDYRGYLEKMIAHLTGMSCQIKCSLMSEHEEKEKDAPPSAEASAKDNALVRQAVAMFGEDVVTIINDK